ncbi:TetR/AcrR family transcriptional regulator [Myceligenerans xiligouense]|uniref:TetR family transcriptional regulator n=1 Tax=Myceligenerans xiligouense TaxID=253184 RepID=A0A3N4Z9X5_9MICO|nr:TetR/AcrR family transcriptional regulator [Myceligenerans xiligouense]RPF22658.1 TetR family transcriptional regulator [Myceligenerans xiligouense]
MDDVDRTPSPKTRGQHAASRATRTAILDAALEVFAEEGFRSGSLRLIAARVGMSEAGLLHHFPSKKALLLAVLERRRESINSMMSSDFTDGEASLRGIVRMAAGLARTRTSVKFFSAISGEAISSSHPAHAYFVARYETLRDQLTTAFDDLLLQGRMRSTIHPRSAAIAAIALMDGLQTQWLLDPEAVDISASLRDHFAALVDIDFDAPVAR